MKTTWNHEHPTSEKLIEGKYMQCWSVTRPVGIIEGIYGTDTEGQVMGTMDNLT